MIKFIILLAIIQQGLTSFLPSLNQENQIERSVDAGEARQSSSVCSTYGYTNPYCDECGLTFNTPNVRIMGGNEAVKNSWPSIVLIHFSVKFYYNQSGLFFLGERETFCAGTLINRRTVLTNAYCFVREITVNGKKYPMKKDDLSMYTVYLGIHNDRGIFNKVTEIRPGFGVGIENFTLHENFNYDTAANNIAIIKLDTAVKPNTIIQPACLPDPAKGSVYPSVPLSSVWTAGWGTLSSDGIYPDTLRNVKLTYYDGNVQCKAYADRGDVYDWTKQICAGDVNGGKGPCMNDGGGPLFYKDDVNGKKKFVLVGILSTGDDCGSKQFPDIYIRVSAYLDWINDKIKKFKL